MRYAPDDYTPPLDALPLFPAHNGTVTSEEAAKRVAPFVNEQQRKVLAAIYANGPMTRGELASYTGLCENSINGRAFESSRDVRGH